MPSSARFPSTLLALILVILTGSGCTKELRKNQHLARGNSEFRALHYDLAEIEYLKVLQVSSLDPVAIRQLGLIYQDEGRLPRAHPFLLKASQLESGNIEVLSKLSLNCLALGDFKKASEVAASLLAIQPGHLEALEVLASSARSSNSVEEVRRQIEKLRQADQDKAGYHVAFGTLDIRRQDVTNAEIQFKKALALDPKCVSALGAMGSLYWARKDLTNADIMLKSASELCPARSVRRLLYAQFQLMTGNAPDAKLRLEKITTLAPDYLPAWNMLAQIAFGERKYDSCSSLLQRVLARDPSNYDALLLDANLKLSKGETTKALAEFSQIMNLYGPTLQVQLDLARAYLFNNDTGKAIASLNQAVAADPNFSEAVLLLANLNIRKGNISQAVFSLTDLIKRQPQIPQAYLLLANAYLAKKEPDLALDACGQMEERFPKSPEVPLILGLVLVQQHRPTEARRAFEKSIQLSPDFLPALEQIVDLDLADQKYGAALDQAKNQIDRNSHAGEPWLLLAKVYIARAESHIEPGNRQDRSKPKPRLDDVPAAEEDVTQAETALLKSIQLNPGLRNSYLMLAQLYVSCNKQEQALDRLNAFLVKTNDLAAWMQVGMIQDGLKNYSAARQAYDKAIAINPNFSLALNNLAYLYSEHFGNLDKAYQLAEKARQLLPDDPSTADTLGWILYKRGEFGRALGIIQESAAKLPTEPEIQFHLGMTHYMLGEEDAARVALEQASNASRDFPGKDEARHRLRVLAIDVGVADAGTLSYLERYLHETPGDPVALCRLGGIQQRGGAFERAAENYQTALKYSPKNPRILLNLAQLYSSAALHDTQKALEMAKEAHSLAPDDPQISYVLGRLVYDGGDFQWSVSLLEDSARKLPQDPQIVYDLGRAYYSVGRVSEAETVMQKVLRANSAALNQQANCFLTLVAAARDGAKAEQNSTRAQKSLREDPSYLPALMITALARERQSDFKQAAQIYDQILAHYPAFSPAMRNLAILYSEQLGDQKKAYTLANKAREAFPQEPELAKILGILEYQRGNYARAARLLKESAQFRSMDAEVFYYLGMAQYQLKARAESKAALEQALALDVQQRLADDAKRVLAELR
jgi:tetratricopeptide (TPR) repeat protein